MFDFEIIDAHIHPFLDTENRLSVYDRPETCPEMMRELLESGVSRACGSVIKAAEITDFEYIRKCNRDTLELRDRYPDFYLPGISVHAAFPEESCREVEEMYRRYGVRWIGELVPYMVGARAFSGKALSPVYELAQELGMPVNIHQADLKDIEKILSDFPELKVVMAHPGEKALYLERLALMKRFPNLYLDISGTGLFRWGMLRHGVREVGAEHFLFGTDFPICNIAMYIYGVLAEKLERREQELVFAENFLRISGY